MTATQTSTQLRPQPGTYKLDPSHTYVTFEARHLMVSKVRGKFEVNEGTLVVDENDDLTSVEATIDATSVQSGDAKRDDHLRNEDFFHVEQHPTITFRSTKVEDHEDGTFTLTGDLSIRDVTRSVTLEGEYLGSSQTPWDTTAIGFSAETKLNRKDWGLNWNMALETGGVLVGDKIKLTIDVEAHKQ